MSPSEEHLQCLLYHTAVQSLTLWAFCLFLNLRATDHGHVSHCLLLQNPLDGDASTPLSAAGVTSGDLLHILQQGPDQRSEQATTSLTSQGPGSRIDAHGAGNASSGPSMNPTSLLDEASQSRAQSLEPLPRQPEDTSAAHGIDDGISTSSVACLEQGGQAIELGEELFPCGVDGWGHVAGEEDEKGGFFEDNDDMDVDLKPDALQIPTYLTRAFSSIGEGAVNPAMTLMVAVHAALLESGLTPAWAVRSCLALASRMLLSVSTPSVALGFASLMLLSDFLCPVRSCEFCLAYVPVRFLCPVRSCEFRLPSPPVIIGTPVCSACRLQYAERKEQAAPTPRGLNNARWTSLHWAECWSQVD